MGADYKGFLVVALSLMLAAAAGCDTGTTSSGSQPAVPAPGSGAVTTTMDTAETSAPAPEEERPVIAEALPYAEIDEQLVYGYFAFPADMVDPLPGIIVVHERWGLDDSTRSLAERLASQGYVVLAIDLFGGKVATDSTQSRNLMLPVVENQHQANENIRQARQFLVDSGQAPRIAILGWSFGATQALNAALELPDLLDAAVLYYGQVSTNTERLVDLSVPVLAFFGENDRGFTGDKVREFDEAMESLGKDYQLELYPGAGHGFADPNGSNYNRDAAEAAWQSALAFLERRLAASPE